MLRSVESQDRIRAGSTSIRGVTDTVSIRDLRVSTVIGVYDWERETEQALVFAVDMAADVAKAASRDDLTDALDYSAVAQTVKSVVIEGKFQLIETAAERVAQRLIATTALPGSGSRWSSRSPARATRPRSPSSAARAGEAALDGLR